MAYFEPGQRPTRYAQNPNRYQGLEQNELHAEKKELDALRIQAARAHDFGAKAFVEACFELAGRIPESYRHTPAFHTLAGSTVTEEDVLRPHSALTDATRRFFEEIIDAAPMGRAELRRHEEDFADRYRNVFTEQFTLAR